MEIDCCRIYIYWDSSLDSTSVTPNSLSFIFSLTLLLLCFKTTLTAPSSQYPNSTHHIFSTCGCQAFCLLPHPSLFTVSHFILFWMTDSVLNCSQAFSVPFFFFFPFFLSPCPNNVLLRYTMPLNPLSSAYVACFHRKINII